MQHVKHVLKIHGRGKTPFGCLKTPFWSLKSRLFLVSAGFRWSRQKTPCLQKDTVRNTVTAFFSWEGNYLILLAPLRRFRYACNILLYYYVFCRPYQNSSTHIQCFFVLVGWCIHLCNFLGALTWAPIFFSQIDVALRNVACRFPGSSLEVETELFPTSWPSKTPGGLRVGWIVIWELCCRSSILTNIVFSGQHGLAEQATVSLYRLVYRLYIYTIIYMDLYGRFVPLPV